MNTQQTSERLEALAAKWRERSSNAKIQALDFDESLQCADELDKLRASLPEPGVVSRDREADRNRFTDKAFNSWLDTGISDAGHTAWDAVGDTQAAWQGWEARQFAGDAVLLARCCGREECGGECGNEWLGMDMYRKPGAHLTPPTAPEANPNLCPKCKTWPVDGEACPRCGERKPFHAPEAAPAGEVVAGFDKRFADMLLGVINDVQDALGFDDEAKQCSNGSLEIVAAIRDLQRNATPQPAPAAQGAWQALIIAEAALADIGDSDREPGDDIAWAERRAAEALPIIRRTLATAQQPVAVDGAMVERVAQHIGMAADYIDKSYPDAKMLDRGPIMRNMRRWHEQLTAALRSGSQGEGQ